MNNNWNNGLQDNKQQTGEKKNKPFYKKKWFIAVIVFVAIGVIGSLNREFDNTTKEEQNSISLSATNNTDDSTILQTSSELSIAVSESSIAEPENKINWKSAGMFKVGVDIPEGEYCVVTNKRGYFAVLSDSSGTLDSIIANENFTTFQFITVSKDQYFEVKNAEFAPSNEIGKIELRGEGMYRVGIDIQAGEYKVKSIDEAQNAYIAVLSDSLGVSNSIISNDNFKGEKYITVKDGQFLLLNRAEIIE